MFQERSASSATWGAAKLALTMDGQIVANRITTGQLVVDDGQGGILLSADMSNRTVTIASFTVKGTKLYSGKSTINSNTYGVYVGTDGFATGSGTNYIAMSGGQIYGGSNGSNGYLIFNSYASDSGVDGARLAGRGNVGIVTNGWFGVSDRWYGKDSEATFSSGENGSFQAPIAINSDGTVARWVTVTFVHGLMNTVL